MTRQRNSGPKPDSNGGNLFPGELPKEWIIPPGRLYAITSPWITVPLPTLPYPGEDVSPPKPEIHSVFSNDPKTLKEIARLKVAQSGED